VAILTLQPDAAAGKDALLSSGAPTTNYGTLVSVRVGSLPTAAALRSLIAPPSLPPAGSIITSATLSLWEVTADSSAGAPASWAVELRKVLRNWVEAEATWNKFSTAGGDWATAGCSNATDCDATALAAVTLDKTPADDFITWSGAGLTALAQAWTDGTSPNYGVLLSAPTAESLGAEWGTSWFHSSDYATDAAKRPKWVIEYRNPVRSIGSGIGSGIASGIA